MKNGFTLMKTKKTLFDEEEILKAFKSTKSPGMRLSQLKKILGIKPHESRLLRRMLQNLVERGDLIKLRKRLYALPLQSGLISGKLKMHPRGFGFVASIPSPETEAYIHRENISSAMHGDTVMVQIYESTMKRPGILTHLEGRITKVIKRANTTVIGTLLKGEKSFYVVPDNIRIIQDIWISPESVNHAISGDKVRVSIIQWPNKHLNPEGEVLEVLGHADDPKIDLHGILASNDWSKTFPERVENEAEKLKMKKYLEDPGRTDLRHLDAFTIDPEDARDFDDAISIKKEKDGWLLGVHIADVSAFVPTGSYIDNEAKKRANTVYFIDETVRMLPERLTWDTCSLRPQSDRLAKSVLIRISNSGVVQDWELHRSIICSRERFSYQTIHQFLESPSKKNPLYKDIIELKLLTKKLRSKRLKNGAITLNFPESKFSLSSDGHVEDITLCKEGFSHAMVEECMLLANQLVAQLMHKNKYPAIYRIHEAPNKSDMDALSEKLQKLGVRAPKITSIKNYQSIIDDTNCLSKSYTIQLNILKSLKQALYSVKNKGHFALGFQIYLHFTSPIRRYADLIVHQMLDQYYFKTSPMHHDLPGLAPIATHCSEQERIADDAEKTYKRLKRLRFLKLMLEENRIRYLDAIITDIKNFGFFVRDKRYLAEGLVHVSDLSKDFYIFDEDHLYLIGRHTREKYRIGDEVRVSIRYIDMIKKEIRFKLY